MWHKADWDKVAQNPESIQMYVASRVGDLLVLKSSLTIARCHERPREDWIHQHDAEKHAESVIAETLEKFAERSVPELSNGALQSSALPSHTAEKPSQEGVSVA